MEFRTMDITLYSGKKLNDVNFFKKMAVYAVVSISGADKTSKQETRTPTVRGGANPTWNFPMKFKVDEAALQQNRLTLDFKLVCERASGDDKDVGELSVPVKELLDPTSSAAHKLFNRRVLKPNGDPKGQLYFTCKFSAKIAPAASAAPPPKPEEKIESGLGLELMKKIDYGLQLGKNVMALGSDLKKRVVESGSGSGLGLEKKKKELGYAWYKLKVGLGLNKEEELVRKANYCDKNYKPVNPNLRYKLDDF